MRNYARKVFLLQILLFLIFLINWIPNKTIKPLKRKWFLRKKKKCENIEKEKRQYPNRFQKRQKMVIDVACKLLKTYLTGMQETARAIHKREMRENILLAYNLRWHIDISTRKWRDIIAKLAQRFHSWGSVTKVKTSLEQFQRKYLFDEKVSKNKMPVQDRSPYRLLFGFCRESRGTRCGFIFIRQN